MITEQQRQEIRAVRIKQAIERLEQICQGQGGLINGNYSAVAARYGLKVKELRAAYDQRRIGGK